MRTTVARPNSEVWESVSEWLQYELKRLNRNYGCSPFDFMKVYYQACLKALEDGEFIFWGGLLIHPHNGKRFTISEVITAVSLMHPAYYCDIVWDIYEGSYNGDWIDKNRLIDYFNGLTDSERNQRDLENEIKEFEEWLQYGV